MVRPEHLAFLIFFSKESHKAFVYDENQKLIESWEGSSQTFLQSFGGPNETRFMAHRPLECGLGPGT